MTVNIPTLGRATVAAVVALGLLMTTPSASRAATPSGEAIGDLTIEQLMNVEITSVSRKEEPLMEAASAIYVITHEDIRRSGVTSIPEALRMAPGLDVARIDGNHWAISARGFNGEFANKLLVLIDGRTVYTPTFSGVYWDAQDTVLEDVERIEVIRGPGATVWGANAVNGVINVITKGAAETQGTLVSAGGGTQEIGFGTVRYGGALGARARYRVYAKYFDRGAQAAALGTPAHDGWDVGRGGFRLDWTPSVADLVTVQGDAYRGGEDETLLDVQLATPFETLVRTRTHLDGRNLLARWQHVLGARADVTLQAYYDHNRREAMDHVERVDTIDLDLQGRVGLGRHDAVWGVGYRGVSDDIDGTFRASFNPEARRYDVPSAFVQDEVTLVPDRLRLTVGTKLEHNDFSGFEVQPSASLLWTPHARYALWASVARAVRTPARTENDIRFVSAAFPTESGVPGLATIEGNRSFGSEKLVAYEVGHRLRPVDTIFVDVAAFYDVYDDLSTLDPRATRVVADPVPHVELPAQFTNGGHGHTYGVETAASWQAAPWWRLMLSSTFLRVHLEHDPSGGAAAVAGPAEGDSPEHQLHVRSYLNLPGDFELDTAVYYVDRLSTQDVPSHVRFDARLGWHPTAAVELSLVAQDILEDHHLEFGRTRTAPAEIERSIYGKVTLRF
jgi:iron complex outermembrane receptor protein